MTGSTVQPTSPDPFSGTLWTEVIARAAAPADDAARPAAWVRLIELYRKPIERLVQHRANRMLQREGVDAIVDDFFSYLVEHDVLPKADRNCGRFRAYIQGVLQRYLLARERIERRHAHLDVDTVPPPGTETNTLADEDERAWADGILRSGLDILARDNPRQAAALALRYGIAAAAAPGGDPLTPAEVADRIGSTTHAVHELARRGRRELRKILARLIADTIHASADGQMEQYLRERSAVEERIRELFPGLLDEADGDA